jgi:hypothetical protein
VSRVLQDRLRHQRQLWHNALTMIRPSFPANGRRHCGRLELRRHIEHVAAKRRALPCARPIPRRSLICQTQLTRDRVRRQNQMECLPEEMRIQLSIVVSNLLGASGLRILRALSAGETDVLHPWNSLRFRLVSFHSCECAASKSDSKLSHSPRPQSQTSVKSSSFPGGGCWTSVP